MGGPPTTHQPRSEQHPAAWLAAFEQACRAAEITGRNRPAAVVAAQQHGLVVCDEPRRASSGEAVERHRVGTWSATELVAALPGGPGTWAAACRSQVSNNVLFSAEYLGNHGIKNPFSLLINEPALPTSSQLAALEANPSTNATAGLARAPYPNIPLSYMYNKNLANSWYEALNLKAEGRYGKRLNFSAIYTWSKALDMASTEQENPGTIDNLAISKSYADFDHPHRFVASSVYDLPFGDTMLKPANKALKKMAGGWELSAITTFEAGPPYSVTMGGADTSFRGGSSTTFPNLTGPPVHADIRQSNGIYLTPQNFVAPPFGQLGTLARHAFHGPGINNFDLGLIKNTVLHENLQLQFRTEMFNAFNHAQFSMANQSLGLSISPPPAGSTTPVVNYLNPSLFGRVKANSPRVVQFAMKLIW